MKKYLLPTTFLLLVLTGTACNQVPYNPEIIETTNTKVITNKSETSQIATPIDKIIQDLEMVDKSFTNIIIFLGKIAIALISLIIVKKIFLLVINRPSQLIIDNFSNASGSIELDTRLLGLSQLGREKLIKEMKGVHQRLKDHIDNLGPKDYRPNDKLPLPQSTPDQRLSYLVASLKEITPAQIDPVVQLLEVIFPVSGTKVNTILQSQGYEYERIGISLEIIDLRGSSHSKLYTIWEPVQQKVDLEDYLSKKPLADRYQNLLRRATRWLAIELCKREMVAAVPRFYFGQKRKYYQSQINNFFGVLNYASAPTHGDLFYKLAIQDLEEAIKNYPQWYQPYENLGDTYSNRGRDLKNPKSLTWQRQAILEYDKALFWCSDELVQRRIKIGRAIAQLNTGDELLIKEAYKEVRHLEKNWDPGFEMNPRFLYNLASWYAIASRDPFRVIAFTHGYTDDNIKQTARLYLVYALIRDKDKTLWEWSIKDPDFHNIRDRFPELQFALLKKLNEFPDLPTTKGKDFVKTIEELLRKHKWL